MHAHLALTIALSGIPSRTSFIFYAGVEGMGGLDLETDEDENVRKQLPLPVLTTKYMRQGIEGPIILTGSTPELDDFSIRIVDGASLPLNTTTHLERCL
jgi:mannosyl-oligosaccharide glucosidase